MFYDRFAAVVLLSAPLEVLIDGVRSHTNNPYGKSIADQDAIRRHVRDVEPLLRAGATLELDGQSVDVIGAHDQVNWASGQMIASGSSQRRYLSLDNELGAGRSHT